MSGGEKGAGVGPSPSPKQARDMTETQFLAALDRHGMKSAGFMGYVEVPLEDGTKVSVCRFNAGERRRDQLAYLLASRDKHKAMGGAK